MHQAGRAVKVYMTSRPPVPTHPQVFHDGSNSKETSLLTIHRRGIDYRARLALGLALLLVIVSYLALSPAPPHVLDTGWDKLNHVSAFVALAFAAWLGFAGRATTSASECWHSWPSAVLLK